MDKEKQELEQRIEALETELKEQKAQLFYLLGFIKGLNIQE